MLIDDICKYFPPFASLSAEDKKSVGFYSYPQQIEKDELLLNTENLGCDNIIIVKEGRLRVVSERAEGRSITLYYLNEADICVLAASNHLYRSHVSIKIIADKTSQIIKIPVALYMELEARYPNIATYSRRLFADRFSDVLYTLSGKVFKKDEDFLKEYLMEKAAQGEDGIIDKTQDEMAKETAIARSHISQILNRLKADGVLSMDRGRIQIKDIKKLL